MRYVSALAIAYLLGSFLPADALARIRGIDIRAAGNGNPGATNAWHVLGPAYGIAAGIYDLSKGLVAMLVAWGLGLSAPWMYAAGIMAVLGHIFPIWHRFRGGQGVGASTGLLLYCLVVSIAAGWMSIAELAALAFLAIVVFALNRRATVVGVAVLPPLVGVILAHGSDPVFATFATLVIGYVWVINVRIALQEGQFHLADSTRKQLQWLRTRER